MSTDRAREAAVEARREAAPAVVLVVTLELAELLLKGPAVWFANVVTFGLCRSGRSCSSPRERSTCCASPAARRGRAGGSGVAEGLRSGRRPARLALVEL
jgi:hypothetical protein